VVKSDNATNKVQEKDCGKGGNVWYRIRCQRVLDLLFVPTRSQKLVMNMPSALSQNGRGVASIASSESMILNR